MSIPNQALEKVCLVCSPTITVMLIARLYAQLVREIEGQAIAAQQQIGQTRAQTTSTQREIRMLRLTLNEISRMPAGSSVFEGVGKM